MANTNNPATMWNCPNYVGALFLVGAYKTPFLNMVGGLTGGGVPTIQSMQFPLVSPYSLESASQPEISETTSLTAPTAWTYVRGVDYNTCQIFQQSVSMSYVSLSTSGVVVADGTTGLAILGNQPVQDQYGFQKTAALKQIAVNVEYTFLQGTYQQATDAGTAAMCRGIVTACTTNTVAAGSAYLTKKLFDQLVRTMAGNGAEFNNPVCFVNAYQKQMLSTIYGYAPEDRNVGGVNIKQIETDFAMVGIVWDPFMPVDKLLIADMTFCQPIFNPVPGKGVLFYEDLAKVGAAEKGQIYGHIGLNYGAEEMHGTVTGLLYS